MVSLRGVSVALLAATLVTTSVRSASADEVSASASVGSASAPPAASTPSGPSKHSIWPGLLIISGVAELGTGIIMAVTAPSLPPGCDSETEKCTRRPNETPAQLSERQDKAGEHEALRTAGYIFVGVGLASITGGIIWCLLEEKKGSASSATAPKAPAPGWTGRVAPWIGSGGGGLATGGTF